MKIAIPVKSNNEIDAHFGHCEFYQIYTVSDDKKIVSTERMESPKGCGCKSNIASVFEKDGVTVMLAGGIGDGAVNVLKQHGISVVRNCQGDVDTLISQYLAGYIVDGGQNCHAHESEHECSHN
jgi:predicted Fe-Mo cluster-binding NifX family protein